MATYYADFDLTTGSNTGADAANAWKTMANAVAGSNGTAPAAGDTVLCKGTDTLAATVTNTIAGSAAGGFVKWIGVNAAWANVGGSTRAILDANRGDFSALTLNGANYNWYENFEIKNAGASGTSRHGITCITNASILGALINCYVHSNYGSGFYSNQVASGWFVVKSRFSENASHGVYRPRGTVFCACRFDNNSAMGFAGLSSECLVGCVAHDNGAEGFFVYAGIPPINCVAYGNTNEGLEINHTANTPTAIVGFRAAGNGHGFSVHSSFRAPVFYFYGDNTTETNAYYDEVLNNGANTVTLNGTDTDEGFVDTSTDDYNLASGATYRRVAVTIP